MKAVTRFALAMAFLLPAGLTEAMGPNPGGKLGEDMPFQGEDVARRAPAATAERQPSPPASQAASCEPQDGQADSPAAAAEKSGCPGTGKETEPKRSDPPSSK